uniref:Probable dipeptidyl-aminopeptidase B n=1 Tax=Bionectria ochroleuca TaxID=29856 RepID=A0A8H7K453_BIOOC
MSAKLEEKCYLETFVAPSWLPGGKIFWYRRATAKDKFEFALVDIDRQSVRPAFHHNDLAKQLEKHAGSTIDSDNLPFTWIEMEDGLVRFRLQKQMWEYNTEEDLLRTWKGQFSQGNPALAYWGAPTSHQPGRRRVAVSFTNNTRSGLDMYAVKPSGETALYLDISQGQTLLQRSGVGAVWKFVGSGSRVKGVYCVPDVQHDAVVLDDTNIDEYMGTCDSDLPEGWEERVTDTGRVYYLDHNTKSTSWRLPLRILPTFSPNQQENSPQFETESDDSTQSRCSQVAEVEKSGDDETTLFVRQYNVWMKSSREERELSSDGSSESPYAPNTIRISPNKQSAIVWQCMAAEDVSISYNIDYTPDNQFLPKLIQTSTQLPGDPIRVDRPRLFSLGTQSEISTTGDLFSNPFSTHDLGWSRKGDEYRFLFIKRGLQCRRILGINCAGSVRVLHEENNSTFLDLNKLYYHTLSRSDRIIWASEEDGYNHLYLIDMTAGHVQNQITKGRWNFRSIEHIDENTEHIWLSAYGYWEEEDPYHVHLVRAKFDGTECISLTKGDGTHNWSYPWSANDRHYFVDTWSRIDLPPQTVVRCFRTGKLQFSLSTTSQLELLSRGWDPAERFVALGRDGKTKIYGLIIRPPNFSVDKRYPVLETIYAGPQDFYTVKSFSGISGQRQWSNDGYVVVQVDGMGTNWRSKAFHDICYRNLKDAGLPDRIIWMQAAAKTRPWMDLSRVGIIGSSAGGQNAVSALLHHGHFYKVAVADSGCHDNRLDNMDWSEQWLGYPVDQAYADNSNITHATNLQQDGRLLLVVGGLDTVVNPASTMRLATEFNRHEKQYELLFIPDGGHNCGSGSGRKKVARFLRKHLEP